MPDQYVCGGCNAVCASDPMYVDIQQASGSKAGKSKGGKGQYKTTVAATTEAPQPATTTEEITSTTTISTSTVAETTSSTTESKATVNAAPAKEYEDATTESPQATKAMQDITTTEAPQTTTSTEETTTGITTTESPKTTTHDELDPLSAYPFINVTEDGLFDSFDELGNSQPMPWIFGSPEEWIRDNTHTLQGNGALRNAAPVGKGQSSNLSLKIRTTKYFAIKCYAYVDIAMPYDYLTLEINGEPRDEIYSPRDEWTQIAGGLHPGENIITFAVKNTHYPAYYDKSGDRLAGSGYVWLDICELVQFG